jgi:hypothetical protein
LKKTKSGLSQIKKLKTSNHNEEFGYEVLERPSREIEIRKYNKQVWAQDHNADSNASYMKLSAYTEGQNKEKRKAPITGPVINSEDIHGPYVAFILLPQEDHPPEPLDEEIKIRKIPEIKYAVISLIGLVTPESFDNALKNKGMKILSGPYFFQYGKPWTLPLNQKNEVAYEI